MAVRDENIELAAIAKYLSRREQDFRGEYAGTAFDDLVRARQNSLNELYVPFAHFALDDGQIVQAQGDTDSLFNLIRDHAASKLSIKRTTIEDGLRALANFPIPTPTEKAALLKELGNGSQITAVDQEHANRISLLFFGALVVATAAITSSLQISQSNAPIGLPAAIAKVQASALSEIWRRDVGERAADVELRLKESQTQFDTLRDGAASFERAIADLTTRSAQIAQGIDDQSATLNGNEAEITRFKAQIMEQLKLQRAGQLWTRRANFTAASFWITAALLVAILVGIPILIFLYRDDLLSFVRHMDAPILPPDASPASVAVAQGIAAIGRLALVTAPLGFAVWLVRYLMRFNMRSLLLMDDARQRVAMLDTTFC